MRRVLLMVLLLCGVARADDATVEKWRHADAASQGFALRLARRAFEAYALRREVIEPPAKVPPGLRGRCGAFVSTMVRGAPRTCMGSLYPTQPDAARELIAAAVLSAGRDKRFAPVKPAELRGLVLMVTFVGVPRAISQEQAQSSAPAREALAARCGRSFGVVLPGETDSAVRMMRWAKVRAGAKSSATVEWFRLAAWRLVERRASLPLKPIQDAGEQR